MDLAEYIKIIRNYKWVILLIVMVSVVAVGVLTYYSPKQYESTVVVQLTSGASDLVSWNASNTENFNAIISTLQQFTEDEAIKQDIAKEVNKELKTSLDKDKFSISVAGFSTSGLVTLLVTAGNPEHTRVIADMATMLLIDKTQTLNSNSMKTAADKIQKKIEAIDLKLAKLRVDLKLLEEGDLSVDDDSVKPMDAKTRLVKISQIQTEITANLNSRQFFVDYINRTSLENIIQGEQFQIVHSASMPTKPSKPVLIVNLMIALAVSLIISMGAALLLDFNLRPKTVDRNSSAPGLAVAER
jgi:capsular polysaccharide biosynthesis protein